MATAGPALPQSDCAEPCSCPYIVSWAQLAGRSNEDTVCLDTCSNAALFAVFDGHGGRAVSDLASTQVPKHLWSQETWPTEPCQALRNALRGCHEEARQAGLAGGSTAVAAVVSDGVVSICNAGDARAVAGLRNGGSRRLSVDHKATCESEATRIRSAGGFVIKGRLCAMIAVTRGLGDFDFEEMGMTCEPHMATISVDEAEFLVLASDGLWDIVDDETCCSLVRTWGRQDTVAYRLAVRARKGGTDDDVSVIVVWLDNAPAPEPSQPV